MGKWLIVIVILLLLAGGGYFVYQKYFSSPVISPLTEVQPTAAPAEELAEWVDQSEFAFRYPKSLKLDPHEEDQQNYAHVELTSATHSGNLIVWVKDTNSKDLEDWVKKTKTTGVLESTLGGESAKKVLTSGDKGQVLIVTTIRDGYLYQIESNFGEGNYWNQVYQIVSSTFKFVSPTQKEIPQKAASGGDTGESATGGDFTEEEEVVE